jgi:glycerol-3-phosphate dehydrogenase (NAD(P)+)
MSEAFNQIQFIGAGAIATALGNVLAIKGKVNVTMLTIEQDVIETVGAAHVNSKYFPKIKLNERLTASGDFGLLNKKALVFIAIPSVAAVDFVVAQKVHPESVLVNLAKGFGNERQTIVESLQARLPNPVCALKGPSFAREIINNQPTSLTLGAEDESLHPIFCELFSETNIYLDFSTDLRGVEILSILKNIYAIAIGVVDAQFESPNLKFMLFTKALAEMRSLLMLVGGRKKTLFNYCGIGDFALTALNDLSRNRTLGLLIGKGFFTDNISEKVVLEGRIAVNIFHDELGKMGVNPAEYPIIHELHKVFNQHYDKSTFVINLLNSAALPGC